MEGNRYLGSEAQDDSEEARADAEDEETSRLMEDHDIDEETAERAQELIDEGLDEDDAVELAEDNL